MEFLNKTKEEIISELQTSVALYKSILNASPDIITITDMKGKIKFSSPKMKEMFGLNQAEDAIGHSVFEFISEKDHQRALENITKMVNGEIPGADVYEGVRLDGTLFDIEVNGEYVRDSEGRILGLILVSRDISDRKKTEEMLRQSEIRYKIFFEDNNSVMLIIAPETGEIKKANPAACRFYGWTCTEICGMNISQINTLSKEALKDEIQKAKEERQNHFYFKHRLANGEVRDVEVYSGPILFEDTTLIYSIVHDISERIRTEESLIRSNRLYAVISHVNQAIVKFKDKNTLLNEVCRIALDDGQFQMVWIGIVDAESMIVKPLMVMGHEYGYLSHIKQITLAERPEGHGPTATALREGNYYVCNDIATDPLMAPWKDEALKRGYRSSIALPVRQFGKIFSAINLYSPIPNFFNKEEIKLLTEVTENISYALEAIDIERERNFAKENIKDHNENLELKIQQRTEQLAETNINLLKEIEDRKRAEDEIMKARKESERANMAKSEFLSRMSHELRTPMNSILGFAQLLEMGELNPGQKKGVRHIMRSGKHLLDLINEVLDISRIEAGQLSLSLEPIQIIGVINEMTDLVSGQANEREIKIELIASENNMIFLRSDKQRLKQILLNLINNAIKYNRPGGSIFLETLVMQKNEAGVTPVRILVRDTGLGIAEEDLPKLFNPFERIGSEKSKTEGTGLGLSVVKKLTEAMGGKVGVESVLGEGSTFWVEFPMSDETSERNSYRSELEMIDRRLVDKRGTILYIEDNISNIELVEEIIASQHLGLTLINNPNGRMALPLAIMNKPSLIFLDLNLPDIHGSEVLRLLQSDENTKNIPVVVISADAMPQQIERLMAVGAKRYITKPIDLNLLLKIIDEFVV
jgi:PAS domain S-box-containing protein